MNKKRIFSTLLAVVMIFTLVPSISFADPTTGSVTAFPDVDYNHWAKEYIYKLAEAGIVGGYSDGTFAPNKTITRAEFAKILVAPLELDLNSTSSSFSDVANTNWASKYIEAAKANGLLYDDGTGKFNPNVPITREYAAFMMGKAIELTGEDLEIRAPLRFIDVEQIAKVFQEELLTTVVYGIIDGYPDETFRPKKSITRAEASKIMNTGLEAIMDTELSMSQLKQFTYHRKERVGAGGVWDYEFNGGTLLTLPIDGVTRKLVEREVGLALTSIPLTGTEEWDMWAPIKFHFCANGTSDQLVKKGYLLEEKRPRNDVEEPWEYRYKSNIIFKERVLNHYVYNVTNPPKDLFNEVAPVKVLKKVEQK